MSDATDKLSSDLPISGNQARNDAFYNLKGKGKRKGRKILFVKRPRRLSEVVARTLEGLRMESQESRAVPNYRTAKTRGKEWQRKQHRSVAP